MRLCGVGVDARAVAVQLLVADAVGVAGASLDHLWAEDLALTDVDDEVIQRESVHRRRSVDTSGGRPPRRR